VSTALGIDVGGTKIAAAIVDLESGEVAEQKVVPTHPERGGSAVLGDCAELADALAPAGDPVGIALCELVGLDGAPATADTVDWRGVDLSARMRREVVVESDVIAAALAEARYGAGRALGEFLYFSIGTGVSYALIADGVPHRGSRGHAIVVGAPPVEEVAGGAALARGLGRPAVDLLSARDGGALAGRIADDLATAIAWLVNALDPEAVIIGGGLGLAAQIFDRLAVLVPERLYKPPADGLRMLPAELGTAAPVIGAAAAAWRAYSSTQEQEKLQS
jgi:glucokinase